MDEQHHRQRLAIGRDAFLADEQAGWFASRAVGRRYDIDHMIDRCDRVMHVRPSQHSISAPRGAYINHGHRYAIVC